MPSPPFCDPLAIGGHGPEMLVMPAGDFLMGSPDDEPERSGNEGPRHKVRFARPFALARFAVTFEEYDRYAAAVPGVPWPEDRGWGRGRRPVVDVTCEEAEAYCRWLTSQTGEPYRLPSEAEWEYCCRAGTVTPFWWGHDISPDLANYFGLRTYNGGRPGRFRRRTVPVGAFAPNPWGLYQMHGNVWEWCADAWNDSYDGAPDDGSAWTSGKTHRAVLRGGALNVPPYGLRAAYRYAENRASNDFETGFRVARDLDAVPSTLIFPQP